jgi:multidrug efflux system outer membrane protein
MKIVLLLATLFLSACNLSPRYERPQQPLPTSWRVESDQSSTLVNARWWESLGDPVLDSLILSALENNKDLQVAVWSVCEFYAQYQMVRSALLPQIDVDASAMKELLPVLTFFPQGFNPVTPVYSFDFNLSYEIDFWGQVRNASKAAYSQFLAQVENRRTVVLTLVSAVASTYFFLRQLDLELLISIQTFESRKESLNLARDRFEGGLTSEIEVTQQASAYQEARAQMKVFETLIAKQENLLSILLGRPPGEITRGKTLYEFNLPDQIPTGLPSELLERRPDILQAENLLIAANANIGVARAAFFPQFSLTGLWGGGSFELKELFSKSSRTWQIGTSMLQQIFTGGKLIGQLRLSEAQQKEALFKYEQTILTAFKEVDDALIAHKNAKELIKIYTAQVGDLKEYLKLSWLRYYEGQTDYLNVLDAERDLFAAQLTLAQTEGSLFLTLTDLYKALGGGWVVVADANLRGPHGSCREQ